jgi:TolB-like protein
LQIEGGSYIPADFQGEHHAERRPVWRLVPSEMLSQLTDARRDVEPPGSGRVGVASKNLVRFSAPRHIHQVRGLLRSHISRISFAGGEMRPRLRRGARFGKVQQLTADDQVPPPGRRQASADAIPQRTLLTRLSAILSFIVELRRRKVVHAALLYLGCGYVALQAIHLVVETYGLSRGVQTAIGYVVIIGFPVVLLLAWAFDWAPDGLHRAEPLRGQTPFRSFLLSAALPAVLVALTFFAGLTLWRMGRFSGVLGHEGAAPVTLETLAGEAIPAVAVLRLQNTGARSEYGWLAEALHAGLNAALSRSSGVIVRSRESVVAFDSANLPPDSLAQALDADFFIGGSVTALDDGVAVTVQLSDAAARRIVASRTFRVPRDLSSLSTVEELTARGAEFLLAALGGEVRVRGWRAATDDAEAFRLRFQAADLETTAREFLRFREPYAAERAYQEADALLAEAAARAPAWLEPILARAKLAERRAELALDDGRAPATVIRLYEEGLTRAEEALRLESADPAALALRGHLRWLLYHYRSAYPGVPRLADGRELLDAAEHDLRSALALDPSLAAAAATLSGLLHIERRAYGEARVFAQKALELDAYLKAAGPIIHRLASASFELEEDSTALGWCREALRRFPDDPRHHACVLDVLAWGDLPADPEAAWRHYRTLLALTAAGGRARVEPYYGAAVAGVLARSGMADSARAVLARVRRQARGANGEVLQRMLWLEAAVRFRLGEADSAQALLERFRGEQPAELPHLLERRILRDFVADVTSAAN